ncbi:MAG: hypothetical protein ACN4GB_05980, partial [Candidatus Nanopelagicales bacterium]
YESPRQSVYPLWDRSRSPRLDSVLGNSDRRTGVTATKEFVGEVTLRNKPSESTNLQLAKHYS